MSRQSKSWKATLRSSFVTGNLKHFDIFDSMHIYLGCCKYQKAWLLFILLVNYPDLRQIRLNVLSARSVEVEPYESIGNYF